MSDQDPEGNLQVKFNHAVLWRLLAETTFLNVALGLFLVFQALGAVHDVRSYLATTAGTILLALSFMRRRDAVRLIDDESADPGSGTGSTR